MIIKLEVYFIYVVLGGVIVTVLATGLKVQTQPRAMDF
jgi:hypothetical protein